jgi:DNA-binding NarL/FixJ family response regulator
MAVRVLLIEDNDVFRHALEVLLTLDTDIEIAGSDPDGNDVVERCRELEPDVVLVDYRLPGIDGVQVTRLVREHAPGVAVVSLTAAAGEREVEALLEAGAVSCLGKDRPLDEIVDAVRSAAGQKGMS